MKKSKGKVLIFHILRTIPMFALHRREISKCRNHSNINRMMEFQIVAGGAMLDLNILGIKYSYLYRFNNIV